MREWQKRAEDVLAQGSTGTNSKRPSQYVKGVYPTHLVRGEGCSVWDTDGKRYIDFICGLGAVSLGYNHPRVTEAVKTQLNKGIVSGSLPDTLEVEVAEIIRADFPKMEKVRFLKTGNEATLAAIKIARAFNNRAYIRSTGYHGHGDIYTYLTPPALGVKDCFKMVSKRVRHLYGQYAAVILEPIMLDDSEDRKAELVEEISWIHGQGGLMIFDEVITGCRVDQSSVAGMWNLDPDLQVLGKGIANGYPLSVVGGKKDIMDSKEYFVSSTFSGESIALAACKATLDEIRTLSLKDLMYYGKRFVGKFNDLCAPIKVKIEGYGTRGMMQLTDYNTALLCQEACKGGVLFGKAFFYNFAHMETPGLEDQVFSVLSDAVERIKNGSVQLEGDLPRDTFVR